MGATPADSYLEALRQIRHGEGYRTTVLARVADTVENVQNRSFVWGRNEPLLSSQDFFKLRCAAPGLSQAFTQTEDSVVVQGWLQGQPGLASSQARSRIREKLMRMQNIRMTYQPCIQNFMQPSLRDIERRYDGASAEEIQHEAACKFKRCCYREFHGANAPGDSD